MKLTPTSSSPDRPARSRSIRRWEAIAESLAAEIESGTLEPGARLPSEGELARRFGVHRHTLRQATHALAARGYVGIRPGSGTYVRKLVLDYRLRNRVRLTETLAESGETAKRELIDSQCEPAGFWASWLELSKSAEVQRLTIRSLVRDRPIALTEHAFPAALGGSVAEAFVRERSIANALAALGVRGYARRRSAISARLPNADEADWLERSVVSPVLVVDFVNVDGAGVPIEAGRTVFAADALKLIVENDEDALGA